MRRLVLLLAVAALAAAVSAQRRPVGASFATRSAVLAKHAMAATSHPLATEAALETMRAGGSAVDAAIAANAVLALLEPTGSGLGGDMFAIVWDAKRKQLSGLNGSGRSPKALTLAEFDKRGLEHIPPFGPLPISVPGCVDGWFTLHERFGKLPMAKVLAPAIGYADEGAPVTRVIAYYWRAGGRVLKDQPGFADVYLPGGRPPREGELFRNPALANTLRTLAKDGRDAFYAGPIAARLAAFVQEHGGFLSAEDLAAHHSEWVEPVSVNYRGYDVFELPPNGQGIAALQILNILEGYDLASMGFGSADHLHAFIEAKKLAFEDRARFYADPAFYDVPVARLLSKDYAAKRRDRIDMQHAASSYPTDAPEHGDTVYLTTADPEGNMVSWIQSNYRGFGSRADATGSRLLPAGPRRAVRPDAGTRELVRAGQAAVPHHHPELRHEGRRAVAQLRRDGWRDAAAGARLGAQQPDRLRDGAAGGRRRATRAPRRLVAADRGADDRWRRGVPRGGVPAGRRRRAAPTRPRRHRERQQRRVRRVSGDPARCDERHLARCIGVAQRRPGGGILGERTAADIPALGGWRPLVRLRRMHIPRSARLLGAALVVLGAAPVLVAQGGPPPLPEGAQTKTTDSGLKYTVIEPGQGDPIAHPGDLVTAQYTGWLKSTGKKFDSSWDRDEPIKVTVGEGVIAGWSEGLQLMPKGAVYRFEVPPELGYGSHGKGEVPPDATLVFDIELLDVRHPPALPPAHPENQKTLEDGLVYEVLEPGEGRTCEAEDPFSMHLSIFGPDGKLLDSTKMSGEPIRATVGGMRYPVLKKMPLHMKKGTVVRVEASKEQALGERTPPGMDNTIWVLEMVDIRKPLPVPDFKMPADDELQSSDTGLKWKIVKQGEGESPKPTDTVTVNYAGRLTDGTLFDSSFQRGEPATFPLKAVIPGWTEGVSMMKPGEVRILVVPGDLAYGEQGSPPQIGPNATLVFWVQLLKVGE